MQKNETMRNLQISTNVNLQKQICMKNKNIFLLEFNSKSGFQNSANLALPNDRRCKKAENTYFIYVNLQI